MSSSVEVARSSISGAAGAGRGGGEAGGDGGGVAPDHPPRQRRDHPGGAGDGRGGELQRDPKLRFDQPKDLNQFGNRPSPCRLANPM